MTADQLDALQSKAPHSYLSDSAENLAVQGEDE